MLVSAKDKKIILKRQKEGYESMVRGRIIKEIMRVGIKFPDWRVGQIITNAVRAKTGQVNCDPFFISDEDFLKGLKKL